ncbi:MAG TPA: DUF4136 domain-containing protein [Candidatus Sulfotelmatobacter sp.]|nr:DUF4136 domain-containing protein [Candidatus Sulfotelmatobacter sp.]
MLLAFLLTLAALPALPKTLIDFDPNLDFSRFKTFAYLGGVEHLSMMPLNPDQIHDEIHAAVTRELTKRGLKEVNPNEHPDLAVRYWVNTQAQGNYAPTGDWNGFALYVGDYWAYTIDLMNAQDVQGGSLLIDLIDVRAKNLAWRVLLEQKVLNANDVWKKVNEEISKAFASFPPSEKQREEKRKERAEHPPKPSQS